MARKKVDIKPRAKKEIDDRSWIKHADKEQRLSISMPVSLHTKLKIKCAEEGRTIKQFIIECAAKYVGK